MPLYEYECEACSSRFERIQKYTDPAPEVCPKCGKGPVRKLFSSPAIQFKGSGFYITDYAKKSSPDASGKSSGGDSGSKESKESKDTKETKSSGKSDGGGSSPAPASTSTDKKD
jgi:putative FmdB family regulatory protein